MAHHKFKVGDRVRARDTRDVGELFRGLVGTIDSVSPEIGRHRPYTVRFDNPPQDRPVGLDEHGGAWSDESLEPYVSTDEVATALASLEDKLNLERQRVADLIRDKTDLEIRVEDYESLVEELEGQIHDLVAEKLHDPLVRTLRYAKTFLDERRRAQVDGYLDGQNEAVS